MWIIFEITPLSNLCLLLLLICEINVNFRFFHFLLFLFFLIFSFFCEFLCKCKSHVFLFPFFAIFLCKIFFTKFFFISLISLFFLFSACAGFLILFYKGGFIKWFENMSKLMKSTTRVCFMHFCHLCIVYVHMFCIQMRWTLVDVENV